MFHCSSSEISTLLTPKSYVGEGDCEECSHRMDKELFIGCATKVHKAQAYYLLLRASVNQFSQLT